MAVGERRYSEQQIAAVIHAALDGPSRVSVPRVLEMAAAGLLRDAQGKPVDAFVGNVGTFRDYVAREARRRRREDVLAQGGKDAAQLLASRLVAVGEREVGKIERKAARGRATVREIRECAALVRDLVKLSRDAGLPDPEMPAPIDPTASEDDGRAADLLADAPTAPAPIV